MPQEGAEIKMPVIIPLQKVIEKPQAKPLTKVNPTIATPLKSEVLDTTNASMELTKSGVTGGATEVGMQKAQEDLKTTAMYKIKLYKFLGEQVGLNMAQVKELPPELQKAIMNFNPKNDEELTAQFSDILQQLQKSDTLVEEQRQTIAEMQKAIVEDKLLSVETLFTALQNQIDETKGNSEEDKNIAKDVLTELQKDLKNSDPAVANNSFKKKLPEITKIIGVGGSAILAFAIWRAMKENLSGLSAN